MNITAQEKKALKGRGYIMTRDGEHFIARLITVDGVLTSEQITVAAQAAEKFGNGKLAMTSRTPLSPLTSILPRPACTPAAPVPGSGPLFPARALCASTA